MQTPNSEKFQSFSNKCSQNMFTKQAMVKTVSRSVKQEIAAVCSDKFPSVFKSQRNALKWIP